MKDTTYFFDVDVTKEKEYKWRGKDCIAVYQ